MNLEKIPEHEQKDFISTFWTMLRECETKADNENDRMLKRWVEGFYRQWNRVTNDNKEPAWIARTKQ